MAHTEEGFIMKSAVRISEAGDGSCKTNLVYRAGVGIALERHTEGRAKPETFAITMDELKGLAPAAADLWSQLENADVPPVDAETPSRNTSKASPEPANSPSSRRRGGGR